MRTLGQDIVRPLSQYVFLRTAVQHVAANQFGIPVAENQHREFLYNFSTSGISGPIFKFLRIILKVEEQRGITRIKM